MKLPFGDANSMNRLACLFVLVSTWVSGCAPAVPAAPVGQACTVYVVKPETTYVSVTGLREYRLYRQGVKSIRVFEFTEQPEKGRR